MPAKQHRIVRGEDFRRIVRQGSRVGGAYCITHAVFHASNETPARFGIIVSKAVGNAVIRNLIRRRFKTVIDRRLAAGISGIDIVFRVLPKASSVAFDDLEQDVTRSLDRMQHLQSQTPTRVRT